MAFEINWYILTAIFCVTGVIFNILNVCVFMNSKMKDISFSYLLAISISDVIYLACNAYLFVTYCNDCSINKTYLTQIYFLYFHEFMSRSMAIFNILTDICLSIQRYLILINKTDSILNNKNYKFVILGLLIFSFLYYLPLTFFKSINKINTNSTNTSSNQYSLDLNYIGKSLIGQIILISISILRSFLGSIVLTIIIILSIYEFKKRVKFTFRPNIKSNESISGQMSIETNFNNSRNKHRVSKNINLMVLYSSSFFIVGNTPHLIIYSLSLVLVKTSQLIMIYRISLIIIFFAHNLNIFIYYSFNKMFKRILITYFKRIFAIIKKFIFLEFLR